MSCSRAGAGRNTPSRRLAPPRASCITAGGPQGTDGHPDRRGRGGGHRAQPGVRLAARPRHLGGGRRRARDGRLGRGRRLRHTAGQAALATILFTDIVDSTVHAQTKGDAAWKRTAAMHEDVVRTVLVRFGGREVETAGDSFLIVFDGAERAIRGGLELVEALAAIRVSIRVGIHSGEVLSDENVRGLAVHAAARILAEAGRARCSCPAPLATWPRALQGWRSSRAGDTTSRVWSASTSCSRPHHPPRRRHSRRRRSIGGLSSPAGRSRSGCRRGRRRGSVDRRVR